MTTDTAPDPETPYSWLRLGASLLLGSIGGVGMWSVVVVLPTVQAEFMADRGGASLSYTATMIGFGVGGVLVGRLTDRFGVLLPMLAASTTLGLGYVAAGFAPSLWMFAIAHGALIGLGAAACFGPLMADISHWFGRRRGIAVALVASGNYVAGTIWPGIVQHFVATEGWRATHVGIGLFCLLAMPPLALVLRRKRPVLPVAAAGTPQPIGRSGDLRLSHGALQALLMVAGVACCVAMSMPQVHIVAYCGDLGYGVARGATMLSLMLGFGIVSRIGSGFIADRIGGLSTVLLGSALQGIALALYLVSDGLTAIYVVSILFGLAQGGIIPSYAIVIREYFPPGEAGTRLGTVIMATVIGMALGGWMSGAIFDHSGSYRLAFLNGVAWNVLNVVIAVWLLMRARRDGARPSAAVPA